MTELPSRPATPMIVPSAAGPEAAGVANDARPRGPFVAAFLNPYVQLAIGAVLVTASELLLRVGARDVTSAGGAAGLFGIAALASAWTWAGIVCYVASFASWLHVLRFIPLGVAFALINVVHVLIPVGAWLLLGEAVSARRWAGVGLVVVGILLVAKPAAAAEAKL